MASRLKRFLGLTKKNNAREAFKRTISPPSNLRNEKGGKVVSNMLESRGIFNETNLSNGTQQPTSSSPSMSSQALQESPYVPYTPPPQSTSPSMSSQEPKESPYVPYTPPSSSATGQLSTRRNSTGTSKQQIYSINSSGRLSSRNMTNNNRLRFQNDLNKIIMDIGLMDESVRNSAYISGIDRMNIFINNLNRVANIRKKNTGRYSRLAILREATNYFKDTSIAERLAKHIGQLNNTDMIIQAIQKSKKDRSQQHTYESVDDEEYYMRPVNSAVATRLSKPPTKEPIYGE